MQYLLDTNAVVYYIGGEPRALETLIPIMQSDASIILPSVVITELWSGKYTPSVEIKVIEEFIASLLILSLDGQLARSAGIIRRNYNLSIGDAMIAATALAWGATLLTRNVRDFKHVPNLSIQQV